LWRYGSLSIDASPREIVAAKRGTVGRLAREPGITPAPPRRKGDVLEVAHHVRPLPRPHAVPAAAAAGAPGPEEMAGEG